MALRGYWPKRESVCLLLCLTAGSGASAQYAFSSQYGEGSGAPLETAFRPGQEAVPGGQPARPPMEHPRWKFRPLEREHLFDPVPRPSLAPYGVSPVFPGLPYQQPVTPYAYSPMAPLAPLQPALTPYGTGSPYWGGPGYPYSPRALTAPLYSPVAPLLPPAPSFYPPVPYVAPPLTVPYW